MNMSRRIVVDEALGKECAVLDMLEWKTHVGTNQLALKKNKSRLKKIGVEHNQKEHFFISSSFSGFLRNLLVFPSFPPVFPKSTSFS